MSLGEMIATLRRESGMTQQALGDLLRVHRTTVARWEAGEVVLGRAALAALCEATRPTMRERAQLAELYTWGED